MVTLKSVGPHLSTSGKYLPSPLEPNKHFRSAPSAFHPPSPSSSCESHTANHSTIHSLNTHQRVQPRLRHSFTPCIPASQLPTEYFPFPEWSPQGSGFTSGVRLPLNCNGTIPRLTRKKKVVDGCLCPCLILEVYGHDHFRNKDVRGEGA